MRPENLIIKQFKPIFRYIYHQLGTSFVYGLLPFFSYIVSFKT